MSQPFFHEELAVKQKFVELARSFHAKSQEEESIENELAAGMLYMNLADYLAEYLVTGFDSLAKEAMGKYYLGMVTHSVKRERMNLEKSISALKQYEFSQKAAVLEELNAIKQARNKLAHEMFKTQSDQLIKIDEAERELALRTENLVNIVDEISTGLPPRNLLEKLDASPVQVQAEAKQEVKEIKDSDDKKRTK